jgi:hypothetical protein
VSNEDIPIEGVSQTASGRLILQDMRAENLLKILLNLGSAHFSDEPEKYFTERRSNSGQMSFPFRLLSI